MDFYVAGFYVQDFRFYLYSCKFMVFLNIMLFNIYIYIIYFILVNIYLNKINFKYFNLKENILILIY